MLNIVNRFTSPSLENLFDLKYILNSKAFLRKLYRMGYRHTLVVDTYVQINIPWIFLLCSRAGHYGVILFKSPFYDFEVQNLHIFD